MTKSCRLPVVFNRPIDPASHPDFAARRTRPVTPEDLGGHYMTAGMGWFCQTDGMIDLENFREDLDRWHNPSLAPGESSPDMMHHNFGRALSPHFGFLRAGNWKDAFKEIKKRGLFVYGCWGMVPGCQDFDKGGPNLRVPKEAHDYIVKALGNRFLGWDNGEQDGRWFWNAMRIAPAPVERRDAHRYFSGYFDPFAGGLQHQVNSLCGLLFPHYFARMDNHRLIGAEFLQALPSVPMWSAWVRGAARQYQMMWYSGMSVFTNFGYKNFEADRINYWVGKDSGVGFPGSQSGPDRGPSLSLIRRAWYVVFMYGCNIQSLEDAMFVRPAGQRPSQVSQSDMDRENLLAPETRKEFLSPLGRLQLDATRFCHKYQDRRGVQYCPVAALLDFHAGWNPPRQLYTDSFYVVWGGIPYDRGDHQVDLFFRELYPGYQDCNYFRNEKGFLTQTPHGDVVDVLLSDCISEVLNRYKVICVLGEIRIEGELFEKLRTYIKRGGRMVWSLNQLGPEALMFCGLAPSGKRTRAKNTRSTNKNGRVIRETPFSLPLLESFCGKAVLETDGVRPVILKKKAGSGEVMTIIPDFGMGPRIREAHPLVGGDPDHDTHMHAYFDKPLGSPYRFIEGIRETVFSYLDQFNLIEVSASLAPFSADGSASRPTAIQYMTNVTRSPDRLVVTVVNNELSIVHARLKGRHGNITRALDLLHDEKELALDDGALTLTLFPSDNADFNLYILELEFDRHVVSFMADGDERPESESPLMDVDSIKNGEVL